MTIAKKELVVDVKTWSNTVSSDIADVSLQKMGLKGIDQSAIARAAWCRMKPKGGSWKFHPDWYACKECKTHLILAPRKGVKGNLCWVVFRWLDVSRGYQCLNRFQCQILQGGNPIINLSHKMKQHYHLTTQSLCWGVLPPGYFQAIQRSSPTDGGWGLSSCPNPKGVKQLEVRWNFECHSIHHL